MGFYSDLMGLYGDLMGLYSDLMGVYGDLMGSNGIEEDLPSGNLSHNYGKITIFKSCRSLQLVNYEIMSMILFVKLLSS